jgi:hypothetical protein
VPTEAERSEKGGGGEGIRGREGTHDKREGWGKERGLGEGEGKDYWRRGWGEEGEEDVRYKGMMGRGRWRQLR